MNKINSYIGFAIKSKKIVYGQDNILSSKTCKIIIADDSVAANTIKKLQTKNIQIFVISFAKHDITCVKGLVFGITDISIASAIKNQLEL